MDTLQKIMEFVNGSFEMRPNDDGTKHFRRTVYWIKRLNPNADEPILIAAYAHDVARAFKKESTITTFKYKEFDDPEILKEHQFQGAKIISDFLSSDNYDKNAIARVHNMISKHEVGGDEESNLLMDADSISYLEVNAVKHIKLVADLGKNKIDNKITWMYDRMTSPQAKAYAKPYYEEAKQKLSRS